MAEWSKAKHLSCFLFGGAGSNPADVKFKYSAIQFSECCLKASSNFLIIYFENLNAFRKLPYHSFDTEAIAPLAQFGRAFGF